MYKEKMLKLVVVVIMRKMTMTTVLKPITMKLLKETASVV
jgi:hypothetical protein